jgi:DNA-binding LacI/PurR family transcriptional regulator
MPKLISQAAVLQRFKRWLATQRLQPGSSLPTERWLAEQLAVSRSSLNRALLQASVEGVLEKASPRRWALRRALRAGPPARQVIVLADPEQAAATEDKPACNFFELRHGALLSRLEEAGLEPVVVTSARPDGAVMGPGTAGVIGIGMHLREPRMLRMLHDLSGHGLPLALADDLLWEDQGTPPGCDLISLDHADGSRQRVAWCHARGLKRPLLIQTRPEHGRRMRWFARQLDGFAGAVGEQRDVHGATLLVIDPLPWSAEHRYADTARILAGFLAPYVLGRQAPDAVLAPTDLAAAMIREAYRILGVRDDRLPAILGHDRTAHLPYERAHLRRSGCILAATVDLQAAQWGRACADLLIDRLSGHLPTATQHRFSPLRLISP